MRLPRPALGITLGIVFAGALTVVLAGCQRADSTAPPGYDLGPEPGTCSATVDGKILVGDITIRVNANTPAGTSPSVYWLECHERNIDHASYNLGNTITLFSTYPPHTGTTAYPTGGTVNLTAAYSTQAYSALYANYYTDGNGTGGSLIISDVDSNGAVSGQFIFNARIPGNPPPGAPTTVTVLAGTFYKALPAR